MNRKAIAAAVGALALGAGVIIAGQASASNPATDPNWDLNTTTHTAYGSTDGHFVSREVQCDSPTDVVVNGGVKLINLVEGVSPINAGFFDVPYSNPTYSGAVVMPYKDSWTAMARIEPGSNGRTFNLEFWALCATS